MGGNEAAWENSKQPHPSPLLELVNPSGSDPLARDLPKLLVLAAALWVAMAAAA